MKPAIIPARRLRALPGPPRASYRLDRRPPGAAPAGEGSRHAPPREFP